jgi:UDP-N-acetyl-2-amino-2-deoxyglucuronate dehydrogenase
MKNFGIIGGGMIARHHAKAIQAMTGGTLGAIYARNPEKAKALSEEFGCKGYSDYPEFLKDDSIEIVAIATASGVHMEQAIAAADAGKHIVCEKPLEVTPEKVERMIAACEKNNVMLAGIFNRRFSKAVQTLKTATDKKRFGQLTLCDAQMKWYRTQEYYDSGEWRGTWDLDGGGALMNQGIHTIDLLLYLAGNVKRVSGTISCLTHTGIEVEDTAAAVLEFENGALGAIQGATSCWSSTGHPAEIQLCGSEGSVFLSDDYFRVWDFKNALPEDEDTRNIFKPGDKKPSGANDPGKIDFFGHQLNFEDAVEALENNRPPLITGEEAMRSVKLINAIYESAKDNGRWVEIS